MATAYPFVEGVDFTLSTNTEPNVPKIIESIELSAISEDIYNTGWNEATSTLTITMVNTLPAGDETILGQLVTANADLPLVELPVPAPVAVMEELPGRETGGNFQSSTAKINIAANQLDHDGWHYADVIHPVDVAVLSAEFRAKAINEGDQIEVIVGPNTVIGVIGADVNIGDTEVFIPAPSLAYVKKGYWLALGPSQTDPSLAEDLGRIVEVKATSVIMEKAAAVLHASTDPTFVCMCVKMIHNFELDADMLYTVGGTKIGASLVPAGVPVRVRYLDNNPSAGKTFRLMFELLY